MFYHKNGQLNWMFPYRLLDSSWLQKSGFIKLPKNAETSLWIRGVGKISFTVSPFPPMKIFLNLSWMQFFALAWNRLQVYAAFKKSSNQSNRRRISWMQYSEYWECALTNFVLVDYSYWLSGSCSKRTLRYFRYSIFFERFKRDQTITC